MEEGQEKILNDDIPKEKESKYKSYRKIFIKYLESSQINPGAVFLRSFKVAFLLFLALWGALTLQGNLKSCEAIINP